MYFYFLQLITMKLIAPVTWNGLSINQIQEQMKHTLRRNNVLMSLKKVRIVRTITY